MRFSLEINFQKGFEGIGLDSPRLLTDGWIMAGIISIMPLSISLGAVSIVSDRSKGLFLKTFTVHL